VTDTNTSIWDDPDVQRIYDIEAGQNAGSDGPASAFVDACLAGIRAVEELPGSVDPGWIKFLIYMVDMNNHFLWDLHHTRTETAAIGEWTVRAIQRFGWGPDGNSTPLGERHSNAMALAAAAGGGMHTTPDGRFEYGDGRAARQAAERGNF